jgi:tripartite-type tricarboxylate transporter receptor subunit TctC
MAVHPSFPAKTVSEFIAYARANPGKVNMASGGSGTAGHLSGELFKLVTGVNMVHVPFRGETPALTDMLAGHVQAMFGTMPASIEHVRAGVADEFEIIDNAQSRSPDVADSDDRTS